MPSQKIACPGLSGFLSGFRKEKESNQRKRKALREGKAVTLKTTDEER